MRLLPREEEFFDLFLQVAERNKEAAQHLRALFEAPPERRTPIVESIKRLEHEADQVTHEVVTRLDRTFITPVSGRRRRATLTRCHPPAPLAHDSRHLRPRRPVCCSSCTARTRRPRVCH